MYVKRNVTLQKQTNTEGEFLNRLEDCSKSRLKAEVFGKKLKVLIDDDETRESVINNVTRKDERTDIEVN